MAHKGGGGSGQGSVVQHRGASHPDLHKLADNGRALWGEGQGRRSERNSAEGLPAQACKVWRLSRQN